MLGITEIGSYIPTRRLSNYARTDQFGITNDFIDEKIGVRHISIKDADEDSSDLAIKAFENLTKKIDIKHEEVDALVVVTQNPDYNIPQTSAMLHGELGFNDNCAAFDISLGCSGYVYALSIILGFMKENHLRKGLLFTSDPYSKIVDHTDKNTSLLFGDGAAVTYISAHPSFIPAKFSFGTMGKNYQDLICRNNKLYMNGRSVFNFAAKQVPTDVARVLELNDIKIQDVDRFVFHQGSLHIVNTIAKRLEIPPEKVVFDAWDYGNTVSSSIPIILEKEIKKQNNKTILICGFGVGLSWASTVLKRIN